MCVEGFFCDNVVRRCGCVSIIIISNMLRVMYFHYHLYRVANHAFPLSSLLHSLSFPPMCCVAIELHRFEALCGFQQLSSIAESVAQNPELRVLLGDSVVAEFEAKYAPELPREQRKLLLALLFRTVMTSTKLAVATALDHLVSRLSAKLQRDTREDLLMRLHSQHPGDVGCLAVFFLNYRVLQPGEALFMAPNEPHAYLHGDCVECMACSDNVVRAGLTPKFIDVPTLCNMLTYDDDSFSTMFMGTGVTVTGVDNVFTYAPPVEEFMVKRVVLGGSASMESATWQLKTVSILLLVQGSAVLHVEWQGSNDTTVNISVGDIFLVAAGAKITASGKNALLFTASCNESILQ